jgi:5-carboxymethyl-2-hydroxymuconate isomerase
MPQISVEYSAELAAFFDRRSFALALHAEGSRLAGSDLGDYKTRFRDVAEVVVGEGSPCEAMVHVVVELLPGRPADLRRELGELTLSLALRHIDPPREFRTQVTVDVRELSSYHKAVLSNDVQHTAHHKPRPARPPARRDRP